MKLLRLSLVVVSLLAVTSTPALAVEDYLEFVKGLRSRQFYDTAIEYLDWVDTRADVPPEIKEILPYEKASALMEAALVTRNPDTANQHLDRARAFLQEFLKNSPNHERAAQANTELAQVVMRKGKVAVIQSRSPNNQGKKAELQKEARTHFAEARKVYQAAHDQHKAAWEKFKKYIDQNKDPKEFEARAKAERDYIQSQLNLALVTYEDAQTQDTGTEEFKKALGIAATEFEAMHQKYRTQVAGLYARMYQGKCFEEQGDLRKALGIYNELLSHVSNDDAMQKMQDQVRLFRLISLNSEQLHDHQLVIQEAELWLKEHQQKQRTKVGVGIRWELARAQEELAKGREVPPDQQTKLQQQALTNAKVINRMPGEYRDVSQAMISRMMVALDKEASDPKDFLTAHGVSRQEVTKIRPLKDAIAGAKDSTEKAKLEGELGTHLVETARLLNLAIALADKTTEIKDLNQVRYWLSYIYFLQNKSYDAAIQGEFVARRYAKHEESGPTPREAANLAMAAYAQAYNAPNNKDKDFDIQRMIGICDFISNNWSGSKEAIEAQMMLGRMYSQIQKPAEAAVWYDKIPESATDKYLDAQLNAGQAYWAAYLAAGQRPEAERPPAEKLTELQTLAQAKLRNAIAKREATMAETEALPEELVFAKFTLAQMANGSGQYQDALDLLETGKRPVLPAIAVKEGEKRPAKGPTSAVFASEVHKQLLRSYIGMQNLDKAKASMTALEVLEAAETGSGDVTSLYRELGEQFKQEVDRLSKTDKERYKVVLQSFESFLQNLLERKEGQTFNTLYWVGETYSSLGQGVSEKAKAATYFEKAGTAFTDIVTRTEQNAEFATKEQVALARFRLVYCLRLAGKYEEAVKLVRSIIKQRPNALDAQFEAAHVYQDWAAAGGTDAAKHWNTAMHGIKPKKPTDAHVWGWGELAMRLTRQIDGPKTGQSEQYMTQLLDARYNLATARERSAQVESSEKKKTEILLNAEQDITYTAALVPLDTDSYAKFNTLYRSVLQQLKKEPKDLEQFKPVIVENKPKTKKKADGPKASAEVKPVTPPEPPKSVFSIWLVLFGVVALAVMGGFAFLATRKPKHKVAVATYGAPPMGPETAAAAPAKPKVRAKQPAPTAPTPSATGTTGAAATAAPGGAAPKPASAATKPAPKPPAPATGAAGGGGAAAAKGAPRNPAKPAE